MKLNIRAKKGVEENCEQKTIINLIIFCANKLTSIFLREVQGVVTLL